MPRCPASLFDLQSHRFASALTFASELILHQSRFCIGTDFCIRADFAIGLIFAIGADFFVIGGLFWRFALNLSFVTGVLFCTLWCTMLVLFFIRLRKILRKIFCGWGREWRCTVVWVLL